MITDEYLDYVGMYKFFVFIHSLVVADTRQNDLAAELVKMMEDSNDTNGFYPDEDENV